MHRYQTPRICARLFPLAATALLCALLTHTAHATPKPDALLTIDQNRSAVVEKIVASWGKEIPGAQAESFKQKLSGLRADHLLAANLSGSFDGVLEVLSAHEAGLSQTSFNQIGITGSAGEQIPAAQNGAFLSNLSQNMGSGLNVPNDQSKALGDANADLVYTPLVPCRLFDTRAGLTSALGTVGGTFSNQQRKSIVPAGACGIPTTGVASLFFSFHAYNNNPSTLGVIGFMKPGAPFSALAATWTGAPWATGTFISSSDPNGNFDAFVGNGQAMTADMIVDVVGYFRAPNGGTGGGSGGTVTNVATGTGLSGGPITTSGTIALANPYKLPQSCANQQVPKYNTSTALWECANDAVGTGGGAGTVTNIATGAGLSGGPITTSGTIGLAATQLLPTTACAANQIAKWNGTAWACAADATGSGGGAGAWTQGGNSFGAVGSIGTLDAQDMKLVTNGTNVSVVTNQNDGLRISRASNAAYLAPNTVNGSYLNSITAGKIGGTVAGGGTDTLAAGAGDFPNGVTGDWGTVSGGVGNAAGDRAAVGGGFGNVASGQASAIPGGGENQATGQFSFAAGYRAQALHNRAFVWNGRSESVSSVNQAFASAAPATFNVLAENGVNLTGPYGGVNIQAADSGVNILAPSELKFGNSTRQMLNLWGTQWGIGIQDDTMYFRRGNSSSGGFAWYAGGSHSNTIQDPGAGGKKIMQLTQVNDLALGNQIQIFKPGSNTEAGFRVSTFDTETFVFVDGRFSGSSLRINKGTSPLVAADIRGGLDVRGDVFFFNNLRVEGTITEVSDVHSKENIARANASSVLNKVLALPISYWNYIKDEDKQRHIGPMAQDFRRIFGLGKDDQTIASMDRSGVALAAIQGLNQKLEAETVKSKSKDAKISALEKSNEMLRKTSDAMQSELAAIKKKLGL